MKRILSPSLNPAGLSSAVLTLYALGTGIWNVAHHGPAIDPQVIVAAVAAVAALFTRTVVTPVKDPKDGAFRPLVPTGTPTIVNVHGEVTEAQMRSIRAALKAEAAKQSGGYPMSETVAAAYPPIGTQAEPPQPVSSDPRERSAQ